MSKKRRGKGTRVDRRSLLKVGLAAGGAVFLMDNQGLRQVFAGDDDDSAGTPRSLYDPSRQAFKRPLRVPEVLEPTDLSPSPGGNFRRPSQKTKVAIAISTPGSPNAAHGPCRAAELPGEVAERALPAGRRQPNSGRPTSFIAIWLIP